MPDAGASVLIPAGASILGGLIGAGGAKSAANTQVGAANAANALNLAQYQQQRADIEPWRQAGMAGLNVLQQDLGLIPGGGPRQGSLVRPFGMADFRADPGYGFTLAEGEKGINRGAAARGMFLSPATMKALNRYNSNLANQTYNDAFNRYRLGQGDIYNRLAGISGVGQSATNQLLGTSENFTTNAGNALLAGGQARASGYTGMGAAFGQAAGQIGNAFRPQFNPYGYNPYGAAPYGAGMGTFDGLPYYNG